MIPMVAPDGSVGEVPTDQVTKAISAGGRLGVKVRSPQGEIGIIPRDNIVQAIQHGAHVEQDSAAYAIKNPSTPITEQDSTIGGLSRIPGNIAGGVKAIASAVTQQGNPVENVMRDVVVQPSVESMQHVMNVAQEHGKAGSGLEKAGMAVAAVPMVGPWAMGTDQQKGLAERKSAGGILAEGLGTIVAGEGIGQAAPKVARGISAIAEKMPSPSDALMSARTKAVTATIPEAAQLPPQARFGAEKMFRAAAPTGANTEFRSAVYGAAGDLAEIGRKLDLSEAKGGVIQPDMRVRATVEAINDHLREMYQDERAPQIQRNADNPVVTKFGEDASNGLDYLARNAGKAEDRAIATKALNSEYLTLAEADALGRAVNRELAPMRGMSPQEMAVTEGNSKRFAGLQALDKEVGDKIATELDNRGEGGIRDYERRYASLSQFRDQLERRVNASELERSNPVGRFAKGVLGGTKGIASASQAAIADVKIGQELQNGLRALADSGIQPKRAVGRGPTPVRGLLTPGATQLPQGEALPTTTQPPQRVVFREPKTGRMKRGYTSGGLQR